MSDMNQVSKAWNTITTKHMFKNHVPGPMQWTKVWIKLLLYKIIKCKSFKHVACEDKLSSPDSKQNEMLSRQVQVIAACWIPKNKNNIKKQFKKQ